MLTWILLHLIYDICVDKREFRYYVNNQIHLKRYLSQHGMVSKFLEAYLNHNTTFYYSVMDYNILWNIKSILFADIIVGLNIYFGFLRVAGYSGLGLG